MALNLASGADWWASESTLAGQNAAIEGKLLTLSDAKLLEKGLIFGL